MLVYVSVEDICYLDKLSFVSWEPEGRLTSSMIQRCSVENQKGAIAIDFFPPW